MADGVRIRYGSNPTQYRKLSSLNCNCATSIVVVAYCRISFVLLFIQHCHGGPRSIRHQLNTILERVDVPCGRSVRDEEWEHHAQIAMHIRCISYTHPVLSLHASSVRILQNTTSKLHTIRRYTNILRPIHPPNPPPYRKDLKEGG